MKTGQPFHTIHQVSPETGLHPGCPRIADAQPGPGEPAEDSQGCASFHVLHAAHNSSYLSVSLMESEHGGHACDSWRPALEMGLLFWREIIIFRVDRFACVCLSAECCLTCLQTSLIPL